MENKSQISFEKVLFGVVLSVLGTFMISYCRTFPKVRMGEKIVTGPSFFPSIIGLLMLLYGVCLVIFNLLPKNRVYQEHKITVNTLINSYELSNFLIFIIFIALYPTIVNVLGFFIGSFLFCVILMKRLQAKWINTIISSLIIVIFTWVIFGKIAYISLPTGILFNK